jgi:phosphohistidine phosphatase
VGRSTVAPAPRSRRGREHIAPVRGRAARVVLLRHGPAELRDPARWPDDRDRPLSRKGTAQTRRVARALVALVGPAAFVATGPAVRSRSTATIVADRLTPGRAVVRWDELDVARRPEPILARLGRELRRDRPVVLVGHDPVLGELLGLAVVGEGLAFARLSKAGAACLEFPARVRPGAARLRWLLTRKQLARKGA